MSTPRLRDSIDDTHDSARLAFILKLVDTMLSMPDAYAIEDVACRMLAENLPVEFAWFAEIASDLQQITIRSEFTRDRSIRLAGMYPGSQLESLVKIIATGEPCIIDDAFQSFNIGSPERSFYEYKRIRSCMAFPVAKKQQALTYIAIADDIPHHWTAREISLIHETAVRIGGAIERITQRKLDEELLRKSEQRLSLALTSAKMGVFEWNSQAHRLTTSAFSKEVFGLMPGEPFPSGDAVFDLTHPDDRGRHRQAFEQASNGGEDYRCIYRILRPIDGETAWIEECGCGYKDDQTGITSIVGVHWDITQRVIAEENRNGLLRLRENFIASAVHELKTPLTSITAYGQLLQQQLEEVQDERSSLMQKLNCQVSRLHKLIRDLLDTSRIAEGKMDLNNSA
jgi:PAS domain S-box-containing protein